MTLSDHEQRVLHEIELQFTSAEDCRWCRLRARLRRCGPTLACLLAALVGAVLVTTLAPAHVTAILGVVTGTAVGAAAAHTVRRRPNAP